MCFIYKYTFQSFYCMNNCMYNFQIKYLTIYISVIYLLSKRRRLNELNRFSRLLNSYNRH